MNLNILLDLKLSEQQYFSINEVAEIYNQISGTKISAASIFLFFLDNSMITSNRNEGTLVCPQKAKDLILFNCTDCPEPFVFSLRGLFFLIENYAIFHESITPKSICNLIT